ncbi:DHH family phosphoesterase [Alkalihalobacillus pseudalcaliphilus]|uniref:DHH family phosphoesterase n=1 Tax=Alkalihalobacillus pseudalcaliphilus TaxID=79884 RepID=UPI00064D8674|nr:bifunctional oligoribonuclease/PAP phosphatase NrnA [Alkalihalobacillus pseudalcaliphilus]KMK74548.1 oligoribonuclease [Alkalihalobacillus pseudalcaliphilus]
MLNQIIEKIEVAETIIIHRHVRPDPDALGSQIGLKKLLTNVYPAKKVYAVGEVEESLLFIGEMDQVEDEVYQNALVLILDTANQERISDERYKLAKSVIKIDHHPAEDQYGDINWVDTYASSTSEMIVSLIESSEKYDSKLDSEVAFPLYAGIVGDTGRFMYNNTTQTTHERAGKLIAAGVDQPSFYSQLHKKSLTTSRLEGYVLQHFIFHENEGVGEMRITADTLQSFGVTANESSQLVNVFSQVEGMKAWVFFVEDEDKIRVRLRSKGPVINTLAQKFNGGGHPMASGATVYSFEEADALIKQLKELCGQN